MMLRRTPTGNGSHIPVTTPGAPTSRTNLTRVRDVAHSIPTSRSTRVTANAAGATGVLNRVRDAIFGIPSSRTVYINVVGAAAAANALARAGRQHGGPVLAGEAYVVGEAGPELLVMGGQSGMVIPNGGIGVPAGGGAMAMAGGPAVHNHFHIAGSVLSEDALIRTVNKAVSNGRVHDRGRRL